LKKGNSPEELFSRIDSMRGQLDGRRPLGGKALEKLMPAHIKASLFGSGLTIPVGRGELLLGTWQGIYLCEHRNHGGSRQVVATLFGRKR
jgi:secondary thiamine-phosphate synthase enzyme